MNALKTVFAHVKPTPKRLVYNPPVDFKHPTQRQLAAIRARLNGQRWSQMPEYLQAAREREEGTYRCKGPCGRDSCPYCEYMDEHDCPLK